MNSPLLCTLLCFFFFLVIVSRSFCLRATIFPQHHLRLEGSPSSLFYFFSSPLAREPLLPLTVTISKINWAPHFSPFFALAIIISTITSPLFLGFSLIGRTAPTILTSLLCWRIHHLCVSLAAPKVELVLTTTWSATLPSNLTRNPSRLYQWCSVAACWIRVFCGAAWPFLLPWSSPSAPLFLLGKISDNNIHHFVAPTCSGCCCLVRPWLYSEGGALLRPSLVQVGFLFNSELVWLAL